MSTTIYLLMEESDEYGSSSEVRGAFSTRDKAEHVLAFYGSRTDLDIEKIEVDAVWELLTTKHQPYCVLLDASTQELRSIEVVAGRSAVGMTTDRGQTFGPHARGRLQNGYRVRVWAKGVSQAISAAQQSLDVFQERNKTGSSS